MTALGYPIIYAESARVGAWMAAQSTVHYRAGAVCIGLEREGALVAGVLYDYCNGASIFTHIVIRGPVIRRWLWYICYYPFIQCGCQVLLALVAGSNRTARRFVEHFGFVLRTIIPQADTDGDLRLYTMKKDECRFLQRSYYGQ